MSQSALGCIIEDGGIEIHIGLDNEGRIFVEDETLARKISECLGKYFSLTTSIDHKETTLPTPNNGPVQAFAIHIGSHHDNVVVIRTSDLILGSGLEALIKSPLVHVTSLRLMSTIGGQRRSGRRNHSTRP